MERLEDLDDLTKAERLERFHNVMAKIIGVDDLFPPDIGVREPAKPRRPIYPKIGAIALDLPSRDFVLA